MLVLQRQWWLGSGQQGASTAGDQHQAEVVGRQVADHLENLLGALDAFQRRFIDPGRPRGMKLNLDQRAKAIRGHIDPAGDLFLDDILSQRLFHGFCHAGTSLAGANDDDSPQG